MNKSIYTIQNSTQMLRKHKVNSVDVPYLVCCIMVFFTCFMYQVQEVFLANIIFILFLLVYNKTISVKNSSALYSFIIFILWTLFSTLVFYIRYNIFEFRNIAQLLFNLQYIIFVFEMKLPIERIKRLIVLFSRILAFVILVAFVFTYDIANHGFGTLFSEGRMWGAKIIPSWPNGIVLPLLFGLYLTLKSTQHRVFWYIIYFIAAVLTTSRVGFLGCVIIGIYFILANWKKTGVRARRRILAAGLVLLLTGITIVAAVPTLLYRITVFWDRGNIATSVIELLKNSPIIGFGGNSFDIAYTMFNSNSATNWGHTHNTILELLIRYGIIGALIFLVFIINCYKRVPKCHRFMFLFLWFISLFQIYFRNFVFLFFIFLLIQDRKIIKCSKGDHICHYSQTKP